MLDRAGILALVCAARPTVAAISTIAISEPAAAAEELYRAIGRPGVAFATFYCSADYDLPALANELHQRFGDIPLMRLSLAELRSRVLVSEASPVLFAGTLRSTLDPTGVATDTEILTALAIANGLDVRGYFHWTLVDNFEWALGFEPRFGFFRYDVATQKRKLRRSGQIYARIIKKHTVPQQLRDRY